jgi:hypothetical protein
VGLTHALAGVRVCHVAIDGALAPFPTGSGGAGAVGQWGRVAAEGRVRGAAWGGWRGIEGGEG